jgi:hypothetical protein
MSNPYPLFSLSINLSAFRFQPSGSSLQVKVSASAFCMALVEVQRVNIAV